MKLQSKLISSLISILFIYLVLSFFIQEQLQKTSNNYQVIKQQINELDIIAKNANTVYESIIPLNDHILDLIEKLKLTQAKFSEAIDEEDEDLLEDLDEIETSFIQRLKIIKSFIRLKEIKELKIKENIETSYKTFLLDGKIYLHRQFNKKELDGKKLRKIGLEAIEIKDTLEKIRIRYKNYLVHSLKDLNLTVRNLKNKIESSEEVADQQIAQLNSLLIFCFVLTFFGALLIVFFLNHSIVKPIENSMILIDKILQGDLTTGLLPNSNQDNLLIHRSDELGRLAYGINNLRNNFFQLFKSNKIQWNDMARTVAMVENSPVPSFFCDLEGIIRYINPEGLKTLHEFSDFLPTKQFLNTSINRFHQNPQMTLDFISDVGNLPFQSVIKLGQDQIQINVCPIYDLSNIHMGTMLTWDIVTKQLQQQNEDLQTSLLVTQQMSGTKTSFLRNISHELRTTLSGIIGFSEMLLDDNLNDELRESLVTINSCSDHLLDLINDILNLNDIETNAISLEYKPLNLEDIIYHCNEVVRHKIKPDQNLELLVSIGSIHSHVIGDPVKIHQVFDHLLNNAVKFTNQGDILTHAELLEDTETYVSFRFSVQDSGIGIDPENHVKIFENFEQADSSSTKKYSGTGLGLSITSKLLKLMNSELKLDSRLGTGSKFYFDLSFQKYKQSSSAIFEKQPLQLQSKTMLIVDDHKQCREIIQKQCSHLGLKVLSASNCDQALELIESHPIDLILSDLDMPDKDGFYLNQELKRKNVKILQIILTTPFRISTMSKIRSGAFFGQLSKPIRRASLISMILKAFELGKDESQKDSIFSKQDEPITLNILLAEDNQVNQIMITKMLERMGHTIELAQDGLEAVTFATQKKYDLILMDLEMPNKNGLEASIDIKESGCNTPIIAITSNIYPEDRLKCSNAGMVDFIAKPVNRQHLHKVLNQHTKQNSHQISIELPKILIAEDTNILLETLENIIHQTIPHSIIKTANDGIEACTILGSFQPHIIICDIMMPNMNGLDLIRYIRNEERYRKSQVIILSVLPFSDESIQQALEFDRVTYQEKPFEYEILLQNIKNCLSNIDDDIS